MAHTPEPAQGGEDDSPAGASQLADLAAREHQVAERERQLAEARAAYRRERDAERERIAADRAKADDLLREAKDIHHETTRSRDRTRRLAVRYARRVKQRWADVRVELDTRQRVLDAAQVQQAADAARFGAVRSDFNVGMAEAADRLREAWATLDTQRQRAAAEWAEANEFAAQQEAAVAARAAELVEREKELAAARSRLDSETTVLRREAGGLEARVQHARAAVEELERRRDQLRVELLAAIVPDAQELPGEMAVALDRRADRDLTQWAAELDERDKQLSQERASLTALKATLERGEAALADQRKVVAEQLVMLAAARGEWQAAEQRTVAEMEDLARGLRQREDDLDAREQRLVRADARRREDAHDLWRLRLQLEAWQSKLTAVDRRWHAERETRDAEYDRRTAVLARREAGVEDLLLRWERVRSDERDRLRTELRAWSDDRTRMAEAVTGYDQRAKEMLTEVMAHAARALAAEELAARSVPDGDSNRATRRLEVLRKRWEKAFRKRLDEIDDRRALAAADLARLDERYQEVQRSLGELAEREAGFNNRSMRADAAVLAATASEPEAGLGEPGASATGGTGYSAELAALREEVERMAAVLLDAGIPEQPDSELPWAAEEPGSDAPDVLPFQPITQAA